MGLADRDYMRDQPDPEPQGPRPNPLIIVIALLVIASFLAAIF